MEHVDFIIDNHHQTPTLDSLEEPQEYIEVADVVEESQEDIEEVDVVEDIEAVDVAENIDVVDFVEESEDIEVVDALEDIEAVDVEEDIDDVDILEESEDIDVVDIIEDSQEDIEDPLDQNVDVTSDETEAADNPGIFYPEDSTNTPDIIEELDNEIIIEHFEEVEPSLDISDVEMTADDGEDSSNQLIILTLLNQMKRRYCLRISRMLK